MSAVINVPEIFGSDVFNEATMKQRLSAQVYNAWRTASRDTSSTERSRGVFLSSASPL